MKKVLSIALLSIGVMAVTACSNDQADITEKDDKTTRVQAVDSEKSLESDKDVSSKEEDGVLAQDIIEKHFQYMQEKDQEKLLTTVTEKYSQPNVSWGLQDIESIKILEIEEDKNKANIQGYLESVRGSESDFGEENFKVFKVKYKVEYVDGSTGPQNSGTYEWNYYVIREDENSPWLIDDFGI